MNGWQARIGRAIVDCILYVILVVLIWIAFLDNPRWIIAYLVLGIAIWSGNYARDRNVAKNLLWEYLFISKNFMDFSDSRIYFIGFVARAVVIYQFVQLFR